MNTPAHLLFGAAVFGKKNQTRVTLAAIAGAMLPDLSLYVMGAVSLFVLQIPAEVVFGQLYFSDAWQQVFAIDNSFVLWGIALAVACWARIPWAIALTGAALLHLAFDFPLHSDDARMHFWPVSDWKFHSPISYWRSSEGANWVGLIEAGLVVVATIWLFIRDTHWGLRITYGLLAAFQILPFIVWRWVF